MPVFNHILFFTAFIIVYSINDHSLFREKNKPGPTPTGSIYPFVQQSSPIDATRSIQAGRFGATERDILQTIQAKIQRRRGIPARFTKHRKVLTSEAIY